MLNKKVIIVGAGPGGLAAGMLLSSKGYKVRIYEKEAIVGGRNGSITLGDYTFDMGPTFFMMKDVLEYIFTATGRKLDDYCEVIPLEPMYRLRYNGEKDLKASSNSDIMRERIEQFSTGSAKGYDKYLERECKKFNTLVPCLSIPYSSVLDFFSWQFIRSLPYLDAHCSLYDVLNRYFDDPDVITSFTFQAKYIGMSPWKAPGTFSIISYIEHGGGIYHIRGGLNKLSKGMAKAFEEEGGEIFLSSPVKEIIIKHKQAVGVLLEDGTVDQADYIIINADFAYAMTTIVDEKNLKKYTKEKLDKKKYSCSTYMLYLGVNKKYKDLEHHNIIFANNYKKNVEEITNMLKLSEDFSFYVQNACVTDSTLAPKGKSTLYVLVPMPNNFSSIDWEKEKLRMRDTVIDAMETRGGFSSVRESIEEELIITPADWEGEHSVYKGATFNLAHNMSQMLLLRPHNKFEEFKNCYLVGGGTHPGSGLPTIYESGRISAELIMKNDGITL
ncbi:MAG: phytoene desaturase family protein [Thermodesulfobacteriota bacterium]|nr:phytoene desaturase family protein [Thermodesulfobacteriota bacterium]